MAETISPKALTTLQRVKDRIYDTNAGQTQPTAFDSVITRMINSCSEWFKRECGAREFVQTTYNKEIYSATGPTQKRVVLRQAPVPFVTFSGNTTQGSAVITGITSTAGLVVGMPIAGDNLPGTTTVNGVQVRNYITVIGTTTITVAQAASTTVTGGYFQANGLLNFEWRAGTPTAPSWMSFIPDQYELVNDGRPGIIRLYGVVPRLYNNMMRISYIAGYPVDWTNAGNGTTHQLPEDISNTVENLVVRIFKRRMLAGRESEALENATTTWRNAIDADDQAVIDHYKRMPTIF